MEKRVVVTGLGLVTPIGNDVPTFWDNLIHGVCGIDFITDFPTEDLAVKIGGKLKDFDPLQYGMDKPFVRKQDPFTIFAMAAAWQAMNDCGLHAGEEKHESRTREQQKHCAAPLHQRRHERLRRLHLRPHDGNEARLLFAHLDDSDGARLYAGGDGGYVVLTDG